MTERVYACKRCGKVYRKRRSLTRKGYCPRGCGAEVAVEVALQLAARSGPAYEAWREATIRALQGTPARGGHAADTGS